MKISNCSCGAPCAGGGVPVSGVESTAGGEGPVIESEVPGEGLRLDDGRDHNLEGLESEADSVQH